jgi:hypothetical protein
MPARSSVAKASPAAPLNRLATNGVEKCGLTVKTGIITNKERNGSSQSMLQMNAP